MERKEKMDNDIGFDLFLACICLVIGIAIGIFFEGLPSERDKENLIRIEESIKNGEITPNEINKGIVFKINNRMYVKVNDEIYLMKNWKE